MARARIPAQIVEEVARKSDMVAVMGRYLQFRRQGKNLLALCPFHSERTPSFNLTPEKGAWYCFGCQEGGSLFDFVMKMEGLSFPEAVQRLGNECGVAVVLETTDEAPTQRDRLLSLLERSVEHYHDLLMKSPVGHDGREYLKTRAIGQETAIRFRLGWARPSGASLLDKLRQAGFTPQEGLLAGVLKERSGRVGDLLRGRLVFPICDAQDRVIALGGRIIGEGQPKYLNSSETEIYSKRQHLFGLNLARGPASRADEAIVVEGFLDVVSLHQAGFNRAVASLGTSLTPEQAQLLRRYVRSVVLAYDADKAGQNATVKGIQLFEEAGLRVRVAMLEPGQDPDSLVRKSGPQALQASLDAAQGVVDFLMEHAASRLDLTRAEGKEDFAREMLDVVGSLKDPVKRDHYLRKLAARIQVSEERLAWRLPRASQRIPHSAAPRPSRAAQFDPEERLLWVCAHEPAWIALTRQHLGPESFTRPELRPLAEALFQHEGREAPLGVSDLLAYLNEEGMRRKWTELLVREPPVSTADDVLKLIRPIVDREKDLRLEVLQREVVPALEAGLIGVDDERVKEYLELKRLRKVKK